MTKAKNSIQVSDFPEGVPKGLVPFRNFAAAMSEFSDFEAFRNTLMRIVKEDSGYAGLLEFDVDLSRISDAEVGKHFMMDSLVVPLRAGDESGYIRFQGNQNGRPFDTEDLMWIGAITDFVSLAYANSRSHYQSQGKTRVFQYLINQLPLGVVCFDAEGGLLVENELASRLLGTSGSKLIHGELSGQALDGGGGRMRMHLEVEGKLLYAEGRRLEVDAGLEITAFVLHDMSSQREMHLLELERSVYRAESRGSSLTVALLEDRTEAGRLLRLLQASAESLELGAGDILALDAYSCACVFAGRRLRKVRCLLRDGCPGALDRESVKGALLSQWTALPEEAPAQSLIDEARRQMRPLGGLLQPAMLVLDSYSGVFDSLEWICGEIIRFEVVEDPDQATARVASGEFDGIFLDLDQYGPAGLDWLSAAAEDAGAGFRTFYLSYKQASMVDADYALAEDAIVFQKPFDAEKLRQSLALHFDFA